jgi:uncharacterized membrane protein YhaH (DUF805 family)
MALEEQQLDMAQQASSDGSAAGAIFGLIFMAIYFGVIIVAIAGAWKTFEKAGRPGWAAIVPLYNMVVGAQIAGKSGWWVVLMMIPGVSIVAGILWGQAMAKVFGKGAGFGVGLTFLSPIFLAILGFGSAEYAAGAPSGHHDQMRRAA